jgi:hypothetical protein
LRDNITENGKLKLSRYKEQTREAKGSDLAAQELRPCKNFEVLIS